MYVLCLDLSVFLERYNFSSLKYQKLNKAMNHLLVFISDLHLWIPIKDKAIFTILVTAFSKLIKVTNDRFYL